MTTPAGDGRPVGVTVAGWIWIVLGALALAGSAVFVLAAVPLISTAKALDLASVAVTVVGPPPGIA